MSLELTKVHNYKPISGTKQVRLESTNPYLRLCRGDGPPLFIQRGVVYSEGSQRIKKTDLPDWFHEELNKVAPARLEEVGWKTEAKTPLEPKKPRGRPPKPASEDVNDGDDQRGNRGES